jgi:competence ComEA-like helix-hairpin-helix protein
VYHAVQGNYERGGAAIEAVSGQLYPPELESIGTPVPGKSLGQRVCILLRPAAADATSGPRTRLEPRVAAWAADVFGDLAQIGCHYTFGVPRLDINEASAAQLAALPGVGAEKAAAIITYRVERGAFEKVDQLAKVPGLDATTVRAIRRWVMAQSEAGANERYYDLIDVNTAPAAELQQLPGIGPDLATAIVKSRATTGPFAALGDLQRVAGVGAGTVNAIRPFATADRHRVSVAAIGVEAVDLLYLCAVPPRGEEKDVGGRPHPLARGETDLEARIHYMVRREHALNGEVPVTIDLARTDDFRYGLEEALELGKQALDTLAAGSALRPDTLSRPSVAAGVSFTADDVNEMDARLAGALQKLCSLIVRLGGEPIPTLDGAAICTASAADADNASRVESLLEASRYGVPGAIPRAQDDSSLDTRCASVLAELVSRAAACLALRAKALRSDPLPPPPRQLSFLVDAGRALLGRSAVILPTFALPNAAALTEAFADTNLLGPNLDGHRVRLWLQQVARVHPAVTVLEDTLIMTDAWRQRTPRADLPAMTLRVAQLSSAPSGRWLALDKDERGEDFHADITTVRDVLSIVAATNDGAGTPTDRYAGLIVDQWDERIPSDTLDTSVAFQYDAPSTQAPQSLLLAVPRQRGIPELWEAGELAAIVADTMDLAKARAVDLDAMARRDGDPPNEPGVGAVLPGLMFPTDPSKPEWGRQAFANSIDEWVTALEYRPSPCADFECYLSGGDFGPKLAELGFGVRSLAAGAPLQWAADRYGVVYPASGIEFTWSAPATGSIVFSVYGIGLQSMAPPKPVITGYTATGVTVASTQTSDQAGTNYAFPLATTRRVRFVGGSDRFGQPWWAIHSICRRDT